MLTLHHLNNSRSQRILWLLEELGLEYHIERYTRDAKTQLAPDSLKKIHPLGKSPILTDDDQVIAESGAIIEYLARHYGPGWIPASDSKAYTQYKYWLHYAEGSLMPYFVMKLVFDKIKTSPLPFLVKPIVSPIVNTIYSEVMKSFLGPNIASNLQFIEAHLAENEWFAGPEISGADIQMSFPLEAGLKGSRRTYEHIQAFLERIHARPAYQKALQAGGTYDYA
jgi:glutathione S-transferase